MFPDTSALAPTVHRLPRHDDDTERTDILDVGDRSRVRLRGVRRGDARGRHGGFTPARRDAAPRARDPRGVGIAFGRSDSSDSALRFLDSWRDFMGPKMRTVCGVLGSPVLYGGNGSAEPRVSVACLEASYATGLGWSDATGEPSTEALVHGAADATLTAVKRLDGRPARLVLVVETAERHARLGSAAREEWAAIRGQLDESTPCGGWLVNDVAAYGRGVQPVAAPGALVVVAVGDSPRGESSRG